MAQSNLAKLAQIDGENKNGLKELSDKEQQFVALLRDVTVANEIYVMLAKRLEEAKVAEASVATEVQVVDSGTLPESPVKPRKAMTLLLAALLGILASSGFVVGVSCSTERLRLPMMWHNTWTCQFWAVSLIWRTCRRICRRRINNLDWL